MWEKLLSKRQWEKSISIGEKFLNKKKSLNGLLVRDNSFSKSKVFNQAKISQGQKGFPMEKTSFNVRQVYYLEKGLQSPNSAVEKFLKLLKFLREKKV